MYKQFIIYIIILLLSHKAAFSQEQLRPLGQNPQKAILKGQANTKDNTPQLPLVLPFFDDFSYIGPYPDPLLWADSMVYINQHYPINSVSIGAATFDAMNQWGEIYPEATINSYQFEADKLSSHFIRLDSIFDPTPMALGPQSDVILSFYFQPQGKGSPPRDRDSLVVEFLHTPGYYMEDPEDPEEEIWVEDYWERMWSTQGQNLESFLEGNNQTYFQRVSIRVENEVYFRNNFRFRFLNYGSFPIIKTPMNMAGNNSVWHLDYVTLDYGRDNEDIYYYDLALAAPAQSLLREFTAIPWHHYIANPDELLRSRFDVKITNLDEIVHNYTYRYFIQDEQGNNIKNYSGGTWNIAPFQLQGYQNFEPHSNPMVITNPLPITTAASREFKIYHVIREGNQGDKRPRNDTIVFDQIFDNYMAYDNGTAHSGYGIIGFNPQAAVRYVLQTQDTLSSVKFYFNPALNDENVINFQLKVWKSLDPEVVLYESDILSTEFPQGISRFVNYPLEEPITVSDTIYVGWKQSSNEFINIGFDKSNNTGKHIFFNADGDWFNSIYQGSLMMRPVFGKQALFAENISENRKNPLKVFPNPVSANQVSIQVPDYHFQNYQVDIVDLRGSLVRTYHNENLLNIAALSPGMYMVRFHCFISQQTFTQKLVIQSR